MGNLKSYNENILSDMSSSFVFGFGWFIDELLMQLLNKRGLTKVI